jgi:glycosyltransferase involved in cell wall biosynthesis
MNDVKRSGIAVTVGGLRGSGSEGEFVNGKAVAQSGFLESLIRYSHRQPLLLLASPSASSEVRHLAQTALETRPADSPLQVQVANGEESLIPLLQQIPVFHDPLGNPYKVSALRRQLKHPMAVTLAQHGISYRFQRWGLFFHYLTFGFRPCDAVICCSNASARAVQRLLETMADQLAPLLAAPPALPTRYPVIPWGIDTDFYQPREQRFARQTLGLPEAPVVFLWVGRLTPVDKADLMPLLLAFRRMVEASPDLPSLLWIVGGEARKGYVNEVMSASIQLGLGDRVIVHTKLETRFTPLAYAAADVFVSPSDNLQESFGITPIEAMACGLPVVVSDWDGYKDTVLHGETGFRVPTYWAKADNPVERLAELYPWEWDHLHIGQSVSVDIPAMTEAMLALLKNPSLRQRMGDAARKHAASQYPWSRIIRLHEELWDELAQQAQSQPLDPSSERSVSLESRSFEVFQNYASHLLTGETEVRLSAEGQQAAKKGLPMQPYSELSILLKPEALLKALQIMRGAGFLGVKGFSLGEIEESLQKQCRMEEQQARLHLMWLLKYGLIQVSSPS